MNRIPRQSPEDAGEDEQPLDLPVNPDEGVPLIPDDDGTVHIPS